MGGTLRGAASGLVLLLLFSPILLPVAATERKELRVYNYSYFIDKGVLELFERETGIKVIYDEFEAGEEAWAKLQAGGGGYDLIVLAHVYVPLAAERGLILKIERERLKNFKNLDEMVLSHPVSPGGEWGIPYMWGTTGIAYRTDCVKDPPKTWREFLSPDYLRKYSGKVTLLSEFSDVFMASMIARGLDITKRDQWNEKTKNEVVELVRSIRGYLRGFWGASEYVKGLVNGEICLAQAWSGDVLVAKEEAAMKGKDVIEYVTPADGTYFWLDYLVIPKGSRNVEGAYLFIDFLLRPDIAGRNIKATYYASAVKRELVEEHAERAGDEELLSMIRGQIVYPPPGTRLLPSPGFDSEMLDLVSRASVESQAQALPVTLIAIVALLVALGMVAFLLRRRGVI